MAKLLTGLALVNTVAERHYSLANSLLDIISCDHGIKFSWWLIVSVLGIRGLTFFMTEIALVHRSTKLTGGTLVIDGNRLCHHLYEGIDVKSGGQYPQFRGAIIDFFTTLLNKEISPVVVLDGIDYNHEKEEEKLRKRNETIQDIRGEPSAPGADDPCPRSATKKVRAHGLPLLNLLTFCQTLKEEP